MNTSELNTTLSQMVTKSCQAGSLGQIVKHGIRLVGNDVRYGMLLSRSAFDDADFLPYRQRILDERRQAWIGC